MKKNITIILFALLLLSSCNKEAPCIDALWKINNTQYVLRVNDCCEHSVNYCNVLLAANIKAYVVVGHVKQGPHAWVMIIHEDVEYFVDPTWGIKYRPAKQWRDRAIKYVFNQGVTPDELRHYKNILERR